jgi:hypothetical protein
MLSLVLEEAFTVPEEIKEALRQTVEFSDCGFAGGAIQGRRHGASNRH